jgi:hypothetical protein
VLLGVKLTPRRWFNILSIIVLVSQFSFAGTTGKLAGRVTAKESGEPLIGANVMIEGSVLGAATDLDGNFYILQIPPGTYSIRFSMIGYQSLVINDVRMMVDLTTTANGVLAESAVGLEEVVVQAERAMIQTDVTYSQANISSEEVDMLPVEEFEDVLALQAGVVMTGGEIHVRGGRGGEISYMIDGISVTDPYNSGVAVEIENNAIQELQFISGTFNAEYGQAMSGIVNIVTKDGNYSDYSGNFSKSFGSYNSGNTDIFDQLDRIDFNNISDIKGNVEGPIIPGKLSFFASGRFKRENGYLYGQRIFHPNSFVWSEVENIWKIDSLVGLGNGDILSETDTLKPVLDSLRAADAFDWVAMDWHEQVTGQAKFSWRMTPYIKISYNRMYSDTKSQDYSHEYRWNPDGRSNSFNTRIGDLIRADWSISQSTFANVMYSRTENHYRSHLSSDPEFYKKIKEDWDAEYFSTFDSNLYYVDPDIFLYSTGNNFYVGGQSMNVYSRKSTVNTLKAEITNQINKEHQLKIGIESRKTNITLSDLQVHYSSNTNNQPRYYAPLITPNNDSFGPNGRTPIELSGYFQDKIEQDQMVMNLGVRFDYFDPDWKVLNDSEDPNYLSPLKPINTWFDLDGDNMISDDEMNDDNRKDDDDRLKSNANGESWFRDVDPKTQISPRFALAFPITESGYMHFSYGHFFQNPSFSYIYDNPEFEVPAASGISNTMGNADMKPQRTTQYEVGFSQQIGRDIGVEITGYFKDIRNLNATEIKKSFIAGDRYGLFVNKDHANSRGITLALSKRSIENFSGNLDYTYSISEGNASDPTAAFYDEASDIEPEKMLVALDWDQRHTLNGTMTYHPTKSSGISGIFSYGSGFPYTTEFAGNRTAFENNGLKPPTYNVDLRAFYNFALNKRMNVSAHINVYNLFNFLNELSVYNDTGRATYSLLPTYTAEYSGPELNTLDEYLVRPHYYSSPRQVKLGISISFK